MLTVYTYFMFQRRYSTPEAGTYYSYDIAVYGPLYRRPVRVVRDVSTDGDLVFRMITTFNENHLLPEHLMDAIQDFLNME